MAFCSRLDPKNNNNNNKTMISPHHLIHAVCIVVTALLIKKNSELRASHNELKHELDQLKVSCHYPGGLPPPHHHHLGDVVRPLDVEQTNGWCSCPCGTGGAKVMQSQTIIHRQFNTVTGGSSAARDMFRDIADAPVIPVDDFGRSMDHDNAGEVPYEGTKIQGSETTLVSVENSQFSPLDQHPAEMRSSEAVGVVPGDIDSGQFIAMQRVDGWTDSSESTSLSFQHTRESLESIQPSPSSFFANGQVKPSAADSLRGANEAEGVREYDNDYYLGSQDWEDHVEDVNVIVTSVEGILNQPSDPYESDYDITNSHHSDYYDEWEEVEEEDEVDDTPPHPAFGNVKLKWMTGHELEDLSKHGSRIKCRGSTLSDRMCHFRNLCLNTLTREYIFLEVSGKSSEDLLIMKPREPLLELSTVAGHNAQYFSFAAMPSMDVRGLNVATFGPTIVFKRFKPDNIMHVFHDDIIPLFHTLLSHQSLKPRLEFEGGRFPFTVFLADGNSEGEFYSLYEAFNNNTFTLESLIASVVKTSANSDASLVCFKEAYVGLSKDTTWYQYGFFKPQGDIPDASAKSFHIHSASSYLLNHLANDCPFCGSGSDGNRHLVLISRRDTRRILNEMELVIAISKQFRVKVMTVSLDETHHLADIIPIVHNSGGIIGMHGSLLSLAIFLRPGSILVELFPFGVDPAKYTPYRRLCQIPHMLIAYQAWANHDPEASVPHPDWAPELGGLRHLPENQQQEIMAQTDVPEHLCCEDPSWLYHIFQDTHVNIPQVLDLISQAMQSAKPWQIAIDINNPHPSKLPGPVQNLACRPREPPASPGLELSWEPPWNAGIFGGKNVTYVILRQGDKPGGKDSEKVVRFDAGSAVRYSVPAEPDVEYRVWVWSLAEGGTDLLGPFAGVEECSA